MISSTTADLQRSARDDVITGAELRAAGMSNHAVSARCRPSGPWQRMLPGVVLLSNTRPSRRQRLRAAVAYAGPEAVVTGVDAVRAHGIEVPEPDDVLVLVPAARRLSSRSYLTVERTTRPPTPVWRAELPMAPLVRATLDAARRMPDHDQLTALLHASVWAGGCTVPELRSELDAGNQRGSAAVRALLTPTLTSNPVVPVAVGLARRVLRRTALPPPRWQAPLRDRSGKPLGTADAWWGEVALAWDFGTRRAGFPDPTRVTATGITLLRTDPRRLRTEPHTVAVELTTAFTKATSAERRRAS